jgi:hypothetical protein
MDNIGQNTKISAKESLGYCESKHHKPWYNEECFKTTDRSKQAELQWFHYPIVENEDNISNVRREARRHFRNKKWDYLKDRVNELE